MNRREKQDLQRLDKFNRWMVVTYWRWLLLKQKYQRQSLFLRLVPFHAVGMLLIFIVFPHDYPNILIIPLIGSTAYYLSLLILFIHPSAYKRKIRVTND